MADDLGMDNLQMANVHGAYLLRGGAIGAEIKSGIREAIKRFEVHEYVLFYDLRVCSAKLPVAFAARYVVGELLGEGGMGLVYAEVRKAEKSEILLFLIMFGVCEQVVIKYVDKSVSREYISKPGETHSLPLEVALMQMVSIPPHCENLVELLQWFKVSVCFILVLERPSPYMDLHEFCTRINSPLSEPLA
ncbi:serine/threonine-protein kinase pim-3-like [Clarias gariepinus]|uniref:serine/threonine-protein kinase pim-3-like n=1 Tax=Clarias gariepinus TaxID=13013 RepID=UPI00234CBCF3|nr:serine/threonine-protein kinase pim-3-like [Clarias gariepinus]